MKLENNNFTIYEVEEIKDKFILFLESEHIKIDFENVTKVDMSTIQLLLSLKKTCEKQNKSFEIINVKEEILDSFEITGTAQILGV